MTSSPSPWLHPFSVLVAVWTFALLAVGGLVTSREAGLAVPDWPTSFGHLVNPPGWTGPSAVFVEHLHRLLGWGLGMLVIAQACWVQARDPRRWMRRLGWMALGLVVVQGVLGGLRVQLLLHSMAAVHGALGQAFFCVTVALALFTSPGWTGAGTPRRAEGAGPLRRWALLAAVAVYLQVVVGAVVRHDLHQEVTLGNAGADASYGDAGVLLPVVLPHIVAGLVAVVVGVKAMGVAFRAAPSEGALTRPALLLGGGLVLQVLLGMGAFLTAVAGFREVTRPFPQFATATVHQAAGAIVLAAAVVLYLRARLLLAPAAGEEEGREASPSLSPAGGGA